MRLVICNKHSKTARKVTVISGVLFLSSIPYVVSFTAISSLIFYFDYGVFTRLYTMTAFRTVEQNYQ